MSDNIFEYELANIKLKLININNKEKSFCDELLSTIHPQSVIRDEYTYEFHGSTKHINTQKTPIVLLNAKYYIHNDICYVEFKNGGTAIWDFSSKIFKYYDGNKYRNLRNWFFLNIIDPFSLACVEKSKLVVHGSLWEKNGIGSIVCGESGSGKSTLSFLAKNELTVHCDDCLVVALEDESIIARPIHSGFGMKKEMLRKYNIEFDENNILVENNDKLYLKRLEKNNFLSANVPVKNIFILRKNSSPKTQIMKLKKSVAIKLFLNLQTSLPTTSFKTKYMLIKSILDKCEVYAVEYNNICDIDVLLKQVAKG